MPTISMIIYMGFFHHVTSLISSVLLDTVFPLAERSCHPADSGHVGGLWRDNLWFAFPLAGQKHLYTVSPHHHLPKVCLKLCACLVQSQYILLCLTLLMLSYIFQGYPTRSTWEPSWLACSIRCSAFMEESCLISLTKVAKVKGQSIN